jgi:hypothetical protein
MSLYIKQHDFELSVCMAIGRLMRSSRETSIEAVLQEKYGHTWEQMANIKIEWIGKEMEIVTISPSDEDNYVSLPHVTRVEIYRFLSWFRS